MSTYAIHAKTFYLPNEVKEGGYLIIEDGKFGKYVNEKPNMEVVELKDCQVAPGLVDTHIHGFLDCDVMDGTWDAVNTISKGLLSCGVTSWLPTTLTASPDQLSHVCKLIGENIGSEEGARVEGIFLEGPFFTEPHKGAQNAAYLLPPSSELFDRWQSDAKGCVRKIAVAAEYEDAPKFAAETVSKGCVVAVGHSDAGVDDTLKVLDAGASVFVHTYNGMRGLNHREPGVVGAALYSGDKTYSEIICDGHHISPIAAAIVKNAKEAAHTVLITDCMRAGGMPDGDYVLGELPVYVEGGTARLKDGGSLAGSILKLIDAVKNVVSWNVATPAEAIQMASATAAIANGLESKCGSIKLGRKADFIVLDSYLNLVKTFMSGDCVYTA